MNVIDMHCDTLMKVFLKKGIEADLFEMTDTMVDFQRMKQGEMLAQFFAIFVLPQYAYESWYHRQPMEEETYIDSCIYVLESNLEKHKEMIGIAYNADMIESNRKYGRMSAVLTIEDGGFLNGSLDRLKKYYDSGIRVMGLTWNHENCLGYPNSTDPAVMERGLTDFGKETVCCMQDMGMLVDVSHLSDGGFWEVMSLAKKPVIATHSNCRAVCHHPRNLTDEMIRKIGECGGVIGINFSPGFLNTDVNCKDSTVERMVEMIRYAQNVGGIDAVALGSDFDGLHGNLELKDCSDYPILKEQLEQQGFSHGEIRKILKDNVLRVLRETR